MTPTNHHPVSWLSNSSSRRVEVEELYTDQFEQPVMKIELMPREIVLNSRSWLPCFIFASMEMQHAADAMEWDW